MADIIFSIGVIIIVATVFGFIARLLKQPLIPAYIISGIVLGPHFLGFMNNLEEIKLLSEIGVAFLLFIVGLELDFSRLKDIGPIASVGTVMQIGIIGAFGFILSMVLGVFGIMEGVYLGLIVSFSSTMVVIKILSDKKEIETLHGRIIIGILLMQDFLALFALSLLGGLQNFSLLFFSMAILKALLLIWATVLSSKFVFPWVFKIAAKSQEILFLLSVTVCFLFAFLAAHIGEILSWAIQLFTDYMPLEVLVMIEPGFSIAIGAFFAGVALANLPYNFEIVAKVKPLRDFFSTLFFASIGMELTFNGLGKYVIPIVFLVFFVVLIKPFITLVTTNIFGYARRTSFLTAIGLSQTSEFALIIASQGLLLGHISQDFFSMTILLTVITITISSYLIKFNKEIFVSTSPFLKNIESIGSNEKKLEFHEPEEKYDIVLVGYDRIGYSIVKTAKKLKRSILIVDYNPDVVKKLIRNGIPALYGDIGDLELIERIDFTKTDIVVSTVPDLRDNEFLVKCVKEENSKTNVIVTARMIEEALELYEVGADYVLLPHFLGGDHISLMLEDMHVDIKKLITERISHIEQLKHRKDLGHEHPSGKKKDHHS